MIRTVIFDISGIVSELEDQYDWNDLALHLDASVKYYLHTAFLASIIDDFIVSISQGDTLMHLKVQIRENSIDDWEYLGWSIDAPNATSKQKHDAYNRGMQGI